MQKVIWFQTCRTCLAQTVQRLTNNADSQPACSRIFPQDKEPRTKPLVVPDTEPEQENRSHAKFWGAAREVTLFPTANQTTCLTIYLKFTDAAKFATHDQFFMRYHRVIGVHFAWVARVGGLDHQGALPARTWPSAARPAASHVLGASRAGSGPPITRPALRFISHWQASINYWTPSWFAWFMNFAPRNVLWDLFSLELVSNIDQLLLPEWIKMRLRPANTKAACQLGSWTAHLIFSPKQCCWWHRNWGGALHIEISIEPRMLEQERNLQRALSQRWMGRPVCDCCPPSPPKKNPLDCGEREKNAAVFRIQNQFTGLTIDTTVTFALPTPCWQAIYIHRCRYEWVPRTSQHIKHLFQLIVHKHCLIGYVWNTNGVH